jgi:hypothetical protein
MVLGCGPDPGAFPCTTNAQCTLGDAIGRCEPEGFCSLPDSSCVSGQRFDTSAGSDLAGNCVLGPADCASWTPHYLSSCAFPDPSDDLTISTGVSYTLDTTDGILTSGGDPQDAAIGTVLIAGEPVVVLSVNSLNIAASGVLHVRGMYPGLIAVWDTASIEGSVNADAETEGTLLAAGANPAICANTAAVVGTSGSDNSAGGGGGAFGANGGSGLGGSGSIGGPGGSMTGVPTDVRGGCAGGDAGALGSDAGTGGLAGGAVVIAAQTSIEVNGTVSANGGGGVGASAGSNTIGGAGGGGGGAGGLVAIVSPMITVVGGLVANGGGGGAGGAKGESGGGGQDGQLGATGASGGTEVCGGSAAGGIGGAGSGSDEDGGAAVTSDACATIGAGGGGGGGSVGYVLLFTTGSGTENSSPPAITQPN